MACKELLTEDQGLNCSSLSENVFEFYQPDAEKEGTRSANFNDRMQMITRQLKNMKMVKGPDSFVKAHNGCRHQTKIAWTSPQISKKIDFNHNMSTSNKLEKEEKNKSDKETTDEDKETADEDKAVSNHQETEKLSTTISKTDDDNVKSDKMKNDHQLPHSARLEKSSIYNNPCCSITKPHVKISDLSLKGSKVGHHQDRVIKVDEASKEIHITKRKNSKMLSRVFGAHSKFYSKATSSVTKFLLSKKSNTKGENGHQEINPIKQDVENPKSNLLRVKQNNHKGKIHTSFLQPSSQEIKTRNLTEMFAASSVNRKAPQDDTNTS